MEAAAAIELQGIDKSFGNVHAVRGVSLRIEKGAITGIVGENGAGKSTLMSILYGLYHADAGEIRVDGKPRSAWKTRATPSPTASAWCTSISCWSTPSPCWRTWCWAPRAERCWPAACAAARAELARLAREYGLHGRSRRAGRRSVGRRAAARRDPEGAVPRRAHPDPRRAERRADAAGDRPAVPHPGDAEGARRHRRPDHPQAARDHGRHRPCLCHAPGPDGGRRAARPRPTPRSWPS